MPGVGGASYIRCVSFGATRVVERLCYTANAWVLLAHRPNEVPCAVAAASNI